uniref:BRCT domain-containing protein n=1 Tax=Heterorhabditis bacteriophora TaxID=37862 RepID=A0A1I7WPI0_HETBA
MSSSVIFSPTKRVRLRKVCVVGDPSDSDIAVINILKDQYECDVFRSETGKEYYNDDDMVFFLNLVSSINGNPKKIIGPAVIRSRSEAHADLFAPRPSRPLYCEIMKDISIVMGGDIKDKRKYVDSVHFMGGHARKEQLVTLGQYVLLPSWVSDCWEHRDDIHFDVLSEHMVRIHLFNYILVFMKFENYRRLTHSFTILFSRANNMRQLNDDHIAHLTLFNDVDRVPRTFIRDVLAYSICGTSGWSRIDKKNVRLMLFNDVILVCMIREEEAKKGTLSRLTRQASLASLRMEPKKP